MDRNINRIRAIKENITEFNFSMEEVSKMAEIKGTEIPEIAQQQKEEFDDLFCMATEILSQLKSLSYGAKCMLESEGFEIEGFEYCIECVKNDYLELGNYIISIAEQLSNLGDVTVNIMQLFDILCEYSSDELCFDEGGGAEKE